MDHQLGMFAKYWQPGRVKTRLAESIGSPAAAAVYRQFVRTLAERFAELGSSRKLVFTPQDREADFRSLAPAAWQFEYQGGGELGARMAKFFKRAFAGGPSLAVLIGSDSPTLPSSFVQQAFAALEDHAVVLGPSDDGGYYLVGVRGATVPPIFDRIDWGTPQVLSQTVERLERHDLHYTLLPTWYDVDTRQDLERLNEQLLGQASKNRTWTRLRQAVEKALLGSPI